MNETAAVPSMFADGVAGRIHGMARLQQNGVIAATAR
jgi:hypothetical protein